MVAIKDLLLPLETPTAPTQALPALPSAPRRPVFSDPVQSAYSLSTHIAQAAIPRTTPPVDAPAIESYKPSKSELKKAASQITRLRAQYEQGEYGQQRDTRLLWICVNRYLLKEEKRSTDGKGLTLVLSHANGFPKETWEPVLDVILANSFTSSTIIDEIWCLDAIQHGDSALLNQGNIGGLFDWRDQARDILHFLLHYIPSAVSATLPTHLPRLSDDVARTRTTHGWTERNLIGIGHSFGAIGTLFAALTHPILFNSIVLVEAVLGTSVDPVETVKRLSRVVVPVAARRSVWSSLEGASGDLAVFPVFRGFHPKEVDVYLETALYVRPDGKIALKQDPVQEALVFEIRSPAYAWELAPHLDPRVDVHWIRGSRPNVFSGKGEVTDDVIRRLSAQRDGREVSMSWINGAHLAVQDDPVGVANSIWTFIGNKGTLEAKL